MADLVRLAAELSDDPLSRGYASMSDQDAADDLNTAYRTQYRDVPVGELAGAVELEGIYEKLQGASTPEAAKLLRLASNQSPITALAYSQSTQRAQIDGLMNQLVSDGVITDGDRGTLKALGTYQVSRAVELNLLGASPEIGFGHVRDARNL